jgi:hypothetical protein
MPSLPGSWVLVGSPLLAVSRIPPELSLHTPGPYSHLMAPSCPCGLDRWLRISSRVLIIVRCVIYLRYSSLFCLGFNPVFCTVFTRHAVFWGIMKKTITHSCVCLYLTNYVTSEGNWLHQILFRGFIAKGVNKYTSYF